MNAHIALTPSQQRMKDLLAITDRPLTDQESDDLYRALHADYMRKWRLAKRDNEAARMDLVASNVSDPHLLDVLRLEAAQPERYPEEVR